MRVTIIVPDDMVIVDGRPIPVDCSELNQNIRVVQWYDDHGEIEFDNAPGRNFRRNGRINDLSDFKSIVDTWQALADKLDLHASTRVMPPHEALNALAKIESVSELQGMPIEKTLDILMRIKTDPRLRGKSLKKALDALEELDARREELNSRLESFPPRGRLTRRANQDK